MPDPTDSAPDSSYDLAPVSPPSQQRPPRKADVAPTGIPQVSTAPPVERDCPHCGFHVVGRPRGNRCPECSAVLNEASGDLIQFCPSSWTRGVAVGAFILLLAIIVYAAGILRAFDLIAFWKPFSFHAAAAGLTALGTFLLTLKDPHPGSRKPVLVSMARVLSVFVLLFWLFLAAHPPQDPDIREPRVDMLMVLAQICLAVLIFVDCTYARALALRIPSDSVAHHFYLLSYALPPMLFVLLYGHYFNLALFITAFFCGFPVIAVLGGTALWIAVTLLRLFVELFNAAAAGDALVARRQRSLESRKSLPADGRSGYFPAPPPARS